MSKEVFLAPHIFLSLYLFFLSSRRQG